MLSARSRSAFSSLLVSAAFKHSSASAAQPAAASLIVLRSDSSRAITRCQERACSIDEHWKYASVPRSPLLHSDTINASLTLLLRSTLDAASVVSARSRSLKLFMELVIDTILTGFARLDSGCPNLQTLSRVSLKLLASRQ